jgi:tetratricopeptide (TPR) repeat protein
VPSSVPARQLAHANQLRRARQWGPATAAYERIIRQFPASAEAYSAKVAAASLRLEKLGDPAAARRHYRQALRSPGSGALNEEILWGLSRAERTAGDPRAERATLERLLATHPQTVHAPYARARLRQLVAEHR